MNQKMIKVLVYFFIIIMSIILIRYVYGILVSEEFDSSLVEVSSKVTKTKIEKELDLELFKSDKFINLKESSGEKTIFKAGRRNPFEPYE